MRPALVPVTSSWLCIRGRSSDGDRRYRHLVALDQGLQSMRAWRVGSLLVLWLTPQITLAQSVLDPDICTSPARGSLEEVQAIEERVSSWINTCLQDWDTATPMSPREWPRDGQGIARE